jgi:hypothetical protein
MRLFQASRYPLQSAASRGHISPAQGIRRPAQQGSSRHDEQLLTTPTVPADPFTAWVDKREADRRASRMAERPTRRLRGAA